MNRGLLRGTHPTLLPSVGVDGWIPFQGMLVFSSVDQAGTSTSVGQMTVIASGFDLSLVKEGDRIKCDHNGVTKYFIVTAKSTSTSLPTLTMISKVNQADLSTASLMRNAAFSPMKNPVGFDPDPLKWRVIKTDTSDRSQASPAANTWYNLGSGALQMATPLGKWSLGWKALLLAVGNAAGSGAVSYGLVAGTLSTGTTTETNIELSAEVDTFTTETVLGITNTCQAGGTQLVRSYESFASITTWNLNIRSRIAIQSIALFGSIITTTMEAISAWL